jgi:ribosomal protein L44E
MSRVVRMPGTCKVCGKPTTRRVRNARRGYRQEWRDRCGSCRVSRKQQQSPRVRSARVRKLIERIKERLSCADCGGTFPPAAMDFDHLPAFPKRFNLSRAGWRSAQAIRAELQKCELVCATCHRIRTMARGGIGRRVGPAPAKRREPEQELLFAG